MTKPGLRRLKRFLDRLNVHTIEGYNVRGQVIALVRDHLKPGEFYKKRDEVGDGAFRRLARRCEPDLLYRVAKADSLGRNAEWVPREQWYGSEAQEWFIQGAENCRSSNVRRNRCCWDATCSSWESSQDRKWARSRVQSTRCSWTGACAISKRRLRQREINQPQMNTDLTRIKNRVLIRGDLRLLLRDAVDCSHAPDERFAVDRDHSALRKNRCKVSRRERRWRDRTREAARRRWRYRSLRNLPVSDPGSRVSVLLPPTTPGIGKVTISNGRPFASVIVRSRLRLSCRIS